MSAGGTRTLARPGRPARGDPRVPVHEIVHETLVASARPLTAYQLITRVAEQLGRQVSPPTVYRALDRLIKSGAIARIESRGAFVPVEPAGRSYQRVFLICGSCGTTVKIDGLEVVHQLKELASMQDFSVARSVIELEGVCRGCGDADGETVGA